MLKKFTLGLCLACAASFGANAAYESTEINGFGTMMKGSFFELSYVGYGQLNISYDASQVGDEWLFSQKTLFDCNYRLDGSFSAASINSGWINEGTLYGARYDYEETSNQVIELDASGNIVAITNLGVTNYGYLVKAVLNPADNMLYCITTDFSSNVYFGKLNPSDINKFYSSFTKISSFNYSASTLPLCLAVKDNTFYYITGEQNLYSLSADGVQTLVGAIPVTSNFLPEEWTGPDKNKAGIAMIYSEELDKFIWNAPRHSGKDEDGSYGSANTYLYALTLPTAGGKIKNEPIYQNVVCGNMGAAYWTAFVAPAEIKEAELGTPKAPAEVTIDEVSKNMFKISWSPVTECTEEGKALDTANLTYRVLLNDEVLEEATTELSCLIEIEPGDEPMDYTAHVWAVCPNAESAEASSNTIVIGGTGVENVEAANGVNAIYTALGTRVNATDASQLPAGLYIIDGKKVIVK